MKTKVGFSNKLSFFLPTESISSDLIFRACEGQRLIFLGLALVRYFFEVRKFYLFWNLVLRGLLERLVVRFEQFIRSQLLTKLFCDWQTRLSLFKFVQYQPVLNAFRRLIVSMEW